jgi:hypothetical protein
MNHHAGDTGRCSSAAISRSKSWPILIRRSNASFEAFFLDFLSISRFSRSGFGIFFGLGICFPPSCDTCSIRGQYAVQEKSCKSLLYAHRIRGMSEKERLNLTVRDDFKRKAAELASKRRRSVSGLFEDLVEQEWSRIRETKSSSKRAKK